MDNMTPEQIEALRRAAKQYADQVREVFAKMAEALKPFLKAVADFVKKIHDNMYAAYVSEGACYGESREGFYRWMEDVIDEMKHRQAIRRIKEQQEWAALCWNYRRQAHLN